MSNEMQVKNDKYQPLNDLPVEIRRLITQWSLDVAAMLIDVFESADEESLTRYHEDDEAWIADTWETIRPDME